MKRDGIDPAWRLVDPLSVTQAAVLIAGFDPNDVVEYREGIPAILQDEAGNTVADAAKTIKVIFYALKSAVLSGALSAKVVSWNPVDKFYSDNFYDPDLPDPPHMPDEIDWSETTVHVTDLNTWLHKRGRPSLFSNGSPASGSWPWGDYTTHYLGLVAEVVREFWATYDPEQPATAPTNEQVETWLREEKRVSQRTAQAIAKICRADDAPTGKR